MARLTREENRAVTRAKLLDVASAHFGRDGYAACSLDRIADEAGFSKGAVYSNFNSKEALFLSVLEEHGRVSLTEIVAEVERAKDIDDAIARIARWATRHSRKGNWPILILEYARQAKPDASFRKSQEKVLRTLWRALGEKLLALRPEVQADPETIGALVYELTYAPAMSFVSRPTAGDLLRVALGALFSDAVTR